MRHDSGPSELVNTTVTGNSAVLYGGLATNPAFSTLNLTNTIVASNLSGGDCSSGVTSLGFNFDSDGSCGFVAIGDISGVDPLLGSLQDNGGPTETHALLPGSPAIDQAPVADCTLTADQRGVARPQGVACDIGAFEVVQVPGVDLPSLSEWALIGLAAAAGWPSVGDARG